MFLEYIPNLETDHLHRYSQERMDGFIRYIREIHKALIRHGCETEEMMIVKDDPSNRVVWLDFDRAET
jgi:phosphoribulokinase